MWARNFETALGLWLALSPFVFGHPDARADLWATDLVCATLIVTLSIASYWPPLRRAHLAELLVAAWLCGFGWLAAWRAEAPPPASQNHVMVGLLVGMLAIVPSWTNHPAPAWARFAGDEETPGP